MKVLLIGGTGNISAYVSALCAERGMELWLLNRGNETAPVPEGTRVIRADIGDEAAVESALQGERFDVVANFVNFHPGQIERDIRLFGGRTDQYIFVSTTCVYQRPLPDYPISEGFALRNDVMHYAAEKIACEEVLRKAFRESGFPATIVRPAHTYGDRMVLLSFCGKNGEWSVLRRMLEGKRVIIHGDGLSLWTLTHSSDFARGFCDLMGNPHAVGQAVHIATDEVKTWNEVYADIARALGVVPRFVHISCEMICAFDPSLTGLLLGDRAHCVFFDNTRIKRLSPGFTARVRFDRGVKNAVDYYLAHPEAQLEDPEFDGWCDRVLAAYDAFLEAGALAVKGV